MKLTGAEILVRALQAQGVEVLFGIPGAKTLHLHDALSRSPLRHILVRHEQGAAHAADGYARASGRVGVCLSTSGPGATNLVTGIATAQMDSIPLVAITCQVEMDAIGTDAFQEADMTGITRSITKHNGLVSSVDRIEGAVAEAFHVASTGRPGAVLLDIPSCVLKARGDYRGSATVDRVGYRPTLDGHPMQIRRAAEALAQAERPLLYVGGGVIASGASEEVRMLAERADLPVVCTLLGLGGFPGTHPLFVGMLGMYGSHAANKAVQHSDLILAVGARFDDRATGNAARFAPDARIIHIDIDPAEIGKNVRVDIPIVGDARRVVRQLLEAIKPCDHGAWIETVDGYRRDHPYPPAREGILTQQATVEAICRRVAGRAVVATDVGLHQMFVARHIPFDSPRNILTSGGLGTMGYGLPAAMGAAFARPGEMVVAVCGDGSFLMNMQELATIAEHGLPVKAIVLNNRNLGMVRQFQRLYFESNFTAIHQPPQIDFTLIARGLGVEAARVTDPEEMAKALDRALAHPGPFVLEVETDAAEEVLPMVPPGGSLSEMTYGEESAAPPRGIEEELSGPR
ncbi:MAG TPA: biosynthetic-type acetolactate synthase large subunit [Armatimonadota bacterium]|nr:biosynthetic-type acetolactate synthase large subunit [Armatimonadota bacterium]HPO71876.1 biosynthetic-type acetolactate synthase large subunit [Armatimonadota bacterium]HPT96989.1 biosynthetic-type acetolactate synthase large subunit [Armatimonadota bacterium]